MKLYYYQRPDGKNNFGDTLNPWLWKQLIPDLLDEDERTAFIGIGTLINEKLFKRTINACQKVIFSTGVGYVKVLPEIDSSYKIYCLRGPLSAQALGVQPDLAITDGAVLVGRLLKPCNRKSHQFSYMPHHRFANDAWNLVCQELGFGYIDPRWPTEKVLTCINQTEVLLAEAMHGAIVADALRVPWIPIVTHPMIHAFKWQDWCQSIDLEYQPVFLAQAYFPPQKSDFLSPLRSVRCWLRHKLVALQLLRITKNSRPLLSSDSRIEQLTIQLEEKLQQFRSDTIAA